MSNKLSQEILSNDSTFEEARRSSMRNDMSSQWNPNLPDLPEAETEEKETIEGENLASVKRLPKVSKWNKVLPEVQASRSSSVSSIKGRGSIAQPGIISKVSHFEFIA